MKPLSRKQQLLVYLVSCSAFNVLRSKQCSSAFLLTSRSCGSSSSFFFQQRHYYYRMWDERYSEDGFAFGTEPNDYLKEVFSLKQLGGNVADKNKTFTMSTADDTTTTTSCATSSKNSNTKCLFLGEGEGRNAVWVAKELRASRNTENYNVTAVDASKVGLQKASKWAHQQGVFITTEHADLANYDLLGNNGGWDWIVAISCHLPPAVRQHVLTQIPAALKSGGYFLLEGYTPAQLEYKTGGPPVAEMMYSAEMLQQAFSRRDDMLILRNQELVRPVVEGKYHTGQAAVVQFLAQKK